MSDTIVLVGAGESEAERDHKRLVGMYAVLGAGYGLGLAHVDPKVDMYEAMAKAYEARPRASNSFIPA